MLRFAAADAPSRSQLGSPAYPQCDREHGMHHGLHLDPVGMPKRMRAEFTFSLKKIAIGTSVVCRCQKWSHRATIACREQAGTPMRSAGASLHQAVIYRRIDRLRRSFQCGLPAPAGKPLPRFAGRRFKRLSVSTRHYSNHHPAGDGKGRHCTHQRSKLTRLRHCQPPLSCLHDSGVK